MVNLIFPLALLFTFLRSHIHATTWPVQIHFNNMTLAPSSEYNETIIVGLITDIYKTLLTLGHFKEDEVIWAPPQGHQLNFSRLDDTSRMDTRVVSLMQQLPTVISYDKCLAPLMQPVKYLDPWELAFSRDIALLQFWAPPGDEVLDMANAEPTVLQLLRGQENDDPCLVLDIADSTSHSRPASCIGMC